MKIDYYAIFLTVSYVILKQIGLIS